jgi:MoCo/4Fe-4S cofactor protein with predicted Tat translocation signal
MSDDRHINFKLMRDRILALSEPPAVAGGSGSDSQPSASGSDKSAPAYWRSLEEFVDAPEFREFVQREYPEHAEEWDDPVERRTFLKLMGASLALAGLSGCVFQPPEKIVPYIKQPEEEVAGKALFFATAVTVGGIATPVLARSNEGRPTKIEGNPDHPNNRNNDPKDRGSSATDIFAQASVLSLYDPDRSQTPTFRDDVRPWSTFVGDMRTALNGEDGKSGLRAKQGAGLRFLTETVTSPTLAAQMKALLTDFPQAKWHQYEPVNHDNARAGAMLAFGQPVNTIYDFSKAERILSLDADFLAAMPGTLRYARDFAARRRITEGKKEMSRLYVIETTPTNTGASADHRWSVRPSEILAMAHSLAAQTAEIHPSGAMIREPEQSLPWVVSIAHDLQENKGKSLIIPGSEMSPEVHALAHAMNAALGNVGKTVFYTDPVEANPVDQTQSLRELVTDIDAGHVELLVIVGGNPAYNTPVDLRLDLNRLNKVNLRVHHGLYKDETSELCHWHIPSTHDLESWSDARSYDGTVSIIQPLIEPLYEGTPVHELLAVFSDQYDRKAYDIVRDYWRTQQSAVGKQEAGGSRQEAGKPTASAEQASAGQPSAPAPPATTPTPAATSGDFETWWRKCVHDGFIPNTALPVKTFALKTEGLGTNAGGTPAVPVTSGASTTSGSQFEIVIRPDPSIYDGRFANNGWLQELPKPLTKVTWDNVALLSPATAKKLNVGKSPSVKGRETYVDTVNITLQGRTLNKVPTFIMPGQPDDVITIHLGYGRARSGRVGNGHGFNVYEIRSSDSLWYASGAQVGKAEGSQYLLATTQMHFNLEDRVFGQEVGLGDRDILRTQTLADYLQGKKEPGEAEEPKDDETLYDPKLYDYKNQGENAPNYAWGMAIDLNNCVGCNACTIACQSENNIPIVGKEQVTRSREMHWIRVDTYFKGEPENPEGPFFQPVPCMHCENAPCEPVCPVHATVHSAEGLNDMVYNRCVGTKYCSNNCPYKVRRFNFFLYQDWEQPTYQLMRNPEVTVRSRGVMEKCTYCVQRIQSAKIQSELEGRTVRDGEIVTACQAVCPTEAIVFGNINDPNSKVSKLKAEPRDYGLLAELNTKPRTTYLSALRNPNPEIGEKKG